MKKLLILLVLSHYTYSFFGIPGQKPTNHWEYIERFKQLKRTYHWQKQCIHQAAELSFFVGEISFLGMLISGTTSLFTQKVPLGYLGISTGIFGLSLVSARLCTKNWLYKDHLPHHIDHVIMHKAWPSLAGKRPDLADHIIGKAGDSLRQKRYDAQNSSFYISQPYAHMHTYSGNSLADDITIPLETVSSGKV